MAKSAIQTVKPTKELSAEISGIVLPAVNPEQALIAFKQYEDLKLKIVDPSVDVQKIEGYDFLKKSYWRKLATMFNLTTEVVSESHEKVGNTYVWSFIYRATAPNGRTATGEGSCDMFEKARWNGKMWLNSKGGRAYPNSIHNIRSTAATRAMNRAISNLVGGGEVSAEEVEK